MTVPKVAQLKSRHDRRLDMNRTVRLLVGTTAIAALAGCAGLSDVSTELAGFGVGAAVGAVTGNPFLAVGAGVATQLALEEGVDFYQREEIGVVHDAIAKVGGEAEEGVSTPWSAESDLPIVSARGQVQVLRDFGGDIRCREIVFTDEAIPDRFFISVICFGGERWHWALSEPSTDRWGNLQ